METVREVSGKPLFHLASLPSGIPQPLEFGFVLQPPSSGVVARLKLDALLALVKDGFDEDS